MNSPHPALDAWDQWWNELDALDLSLKRIPSAFVSQKAFREQAKSVVQSYFRGVRPQLIDLGIADDTIVQLDMINQEVLGLAAKTNRASSYRNKFRDLDELRVSVTTAAEIISGNRGGEAPAGTATTFEASILATLEQIVPTIAQSYRQVLQDLRESHRLSYRGTASELREVLRELLDHLAPDEEVLKKISLEKDQKRPSMKQKATFILKARGIGDTARKTPIAAVETVEESVGALARSVYDRGSLSTHVVTTRQEVVTLKNYADAVLADLLQINR
jgi:hypothetical protein